MTYPPSPNTYWHGDKPLPPRKGREGRAASPVGVPRRGKTTQPEVQSRGSMIGPARCSPTQLPYPLNVKCRILDWSTLKDVERDKAMRVRRMRVKRAGDEAAGDTPAILNGHGIASGVDEETGGVVAAHGG